MCSNFFYLLIYEFLSVIDFIRAKARFAESIGAIVTLPQNEPLIDWQEAVHPLLLLAHRKAGKEVVPLDLSLDRDRRLLIISGPNAGGKSVCLKSDCCNTCSNAASLSR